jgi:hypothetical protein
MHVVLQPDAADRLQLNVHTTFDEHDGGQNPQPWRVYNHTTGELVHVPKEETDHLITLPVHGSYRLTVLSNTASTDHIYSTQPGGPAGPPGSGPGGAPRISGVTPSQLVVGQAPGTVTFHGTGMDSPDITKAMLMSSGGEGTGTSILTVVDGGTLHADFPAPAGRPAGPGYAVLCADQDVEISNRHTVHYVDPPRNFVSFTPTTVPNDNAAFDLTCTGNFGDDVGVLQLRIAQPAMGGTELHSASVVKNSPTEVVAHFADQAGMTIGSAQVYMWVVGEETAYPGSAFVDFATPPGE